MIYGKEFADTFRNARETSEYWMEGLRLDFLEDLQRTMKEKQISQKDLAEKIGKTEAYVSKVINSNISNFTLKTMVQLAMAVGCRLSMAMLSEEKPEKISAVRAGRSLPQKSISIHQSDSLEKKENPQVSKTT